jgi:hypothetical protein
VEGEEVSGDTIKGIVLGIGAPNRAKDGRAVQCGIVLGDDHGLCRVYADFGGVMDRIRVWDRIECEVHIRSSDSRAESWKLVKSETYGKVQNSDEKRSILESCVLRCGDEDPIEFLNRERRSIGLIRQATTGIGYGMEVREFGESPDWVMAQCETPQRPYIWWRSRAGKKHDHQLCSHEAYEWIRKNPSATSQLWTNLRIEDIDYTKWLLVGNTKDHRNVWVVVHVHRLKKTTQQPTLASFSISDGRPSGWPYLPLEDLRARRDASTGQRLLFTT